MKEKVTKATLRPKEKSRPGKTDWKRLSSMTDEDIEKAALSDPDTYLPTKDELKKLKRVYPVKVVNVKKIRSKLHISQTRFAFYFGVSVRTVQEWEQGRRTPSGPTRNFLRVIEMEPQAVQRALDKPPKKKSLS